jgi:signal transduction histidine kinase
MTAWRRLQTRVRELDPFRIDLALTGVLLVAWLFEVSLIADHSAHDKVITGIFGVLAMAPLALRRRAPLVPAFALAGACIASEALTDSSFMVDESTVPFIAFLFELYSIGRYVEGRRMFIGGVVAIGGLFLALTLQSGPTPEDVVWVGFLLGAPLLAGRALRNRIGLNRELAAKAERADADREQRAREAIERERSRIATELQAVVANGVSAMVVQAGAVPRLLDGGDSARAGEALAVIEETGRDALIEMRRLLGVLRRDEDGAELAPQPSLRRAEALIARYDGDGLGVDLVIEGERYELSPGVDLAAYRVVEQSLTAARDGEARSAKVLIRYAERDVELEISDDRADSAAADRTEIAALRDRLSIYGGHLSAGQADGGGFEVRARLPQEVS